MKSSYKSENVTLYIPYYNAEKTIYECLKGAFSQKVLPAEILIIDDGSKEPLMLKEEFAKECRVIRHAVNKGLAAARNTAIGNAKTELIAALDSDVVPEDSWLENMLEGLNSYGNVVGAGGAMYEKFSTELPDRWRSIHMAQNWGDEEILNPRFLFGCNTIFKKDVLLKLGGYDEEYRTNNEDRTISEKIYSSGYNLLYTPKAKAWHLRQDTYKTILKGYWQWHHTKGLMRGDFNSVEGILKRIEEVNFGIFKYRFDLDLKNARFDLLKIDFAIPFVFCALDLELFVNLNKKEKIMFSNLLLNFGAIGKSKKVKHILNFIQEMMPSDMSAQIENEPEWFIEYKKLFFACIKKYNWVNLCDKSEQIDH